MSVALSRPTAAPINRKFGGATDIFPQRGDPELLQIGEANQHGEPCIDAQRLLEGKLFVQLSGMRMHSENASVVMATAH